MAPRHQLIHRVESFDVSFKQIVLVLDPILYQIFELFHFEPDDDFIDIRLIRGGLLDSSCRFFRRRLPRRALVIRHDDSRLRQRICVQVVGCTRLILEEVLHLVQELHYDCRMV